LSTPALHLNTLFVLSEGGRILSTREPVASPGSLFTLVRGATENAWAVRADVPDPVAELVDRLARLEPVAKDLRDPPTHQEQYRSLLASTEQRGSEGGAATREGGGPAFAFPDAIEDESDVVPIEDEGVLAHHFRGWMPGEIAAGCSPMIAVVQDGHPVSICFSARKSDAAAEAGVETAAAYRGRGLAARVTRAWASAIRRSGRTPLYSTSWSNEASLAVARKLGLIVYASSWSLSD
jgi:hypothetical protein